MDTSKKEYSVVRLSTGRSSWGNHIVNFKGERVQGTRDYGDSKVDDAHALCDLLNRVHDAAFSLGMQAQRNEQNGS